MTFRNLVLWAILTASVFVTVLPIAAEEGGGNVAYSPTRQEWVAVLFNSSYRINNMDTHGYRISYAAPPASDTIVLVVTYRKDADLLKMNESIQVSRRMLMVYAKARNWDSWLKVDEKLIPVGGLVNADRSDVEDVNQAEVKGVLDDLLKDSLPDLSKEKRFARPPESSTPSVDDLTP